MHALWEVNEGNGSYYFFPSLLSPLVSEATILPHYLVPLHLCPLIACGTLFYLFFAGHSVQFGFRQNLKYNCSTMFQRWEVAKKMAKVLIVYDSRSGNTKKMAHAIAKGAKNKNAKVTLIPYSPYLFSETHSFCEKCRKKCSQQCEFGKSSA